MAIKRLSNGKRFISHGPRPWREAGLAWARSVRDDPERAFTVLALPTDLAFLSTEERRRCHAFTLIAPPLLAGAEAERLLARFESALDRSRPIARGLGHKGLAVCFGGHSPAQGQALADMRIHPMYEAGWEFFAPEDPRKARRARRLGAEPAPRSDEGSQPWEAAIAAVARALREAGFAVIPAPWILRDHADALEGLGFRERARSFLQDSRMASELRSQLPQGLPPPSRSL